MEKSKEATLLDDELAKIKKADASVKTMEDFTSPSVLYEELISSVQKYHPSTDISMIEKAYRIARDAHEDVYKRQAVCCRESSACRNRDRFT